MSTTPITVLDHADFEVTLTPGIVADEDFLKRDAGTVVGVAASAITTGAATYANGVRETGGPTVLTMGAVADTEIFTRSGTTVDGVLPSAMTVGVATYANGVRETGGPTTLPMGAVAEATFLRRIAGVVVGATAADLNSAIESITAAPDATYDWNTTVRNLAVTHAAAACDVSLPIEAAVTNWAPGSPPRKLFKMNTSAFGINLLTGATCTINGGAADANMSPIPDSDADPSNTILAQWVYVYRETATAYWVLGAA